MTRRIFIHVTLCTATITTKPDGQYLKRPAICTSRYIHHTCDFKYTAQALTTSAQGHYWLSSFHIAINSFQRDLIKVVAIENDVDRVNQVVWGRTFGRPFNLAPSPPVKLVHWILRRQVDGVPALWPRNFFEYCNMPVGAFCAFAIL